MNKNNDNENIGKFSSFTRLQLTHKFESHNDVVNRLHNWLVNYKLLLSRETIASTLSKSQKMILSKFQRNSY